MHFATGFQVILKLLYKHEKTGSVELNSEHYSKFCKKLSPAGNIRNDSEALYGFQMLCRWLDRPSFGDGRTGTRLDPKMFYVVLELTSLSWILARSQKKVISCWARAASPWKKKAEMTSRDNDGVQVSCFFHSNKQVILNRQTDQPYINVSSNSERRNVITCLRPSIYVIKVCSRWYKWLLWCWTAGIFGAVLSVVSGCVD